MTRLRKRTKEQEAVDKKLERHHQKRKKDERQRRKKRIKRHR